MQDKLQPEKQVAYVKQLLTQSTSLTERWLEKNPFPKQRPLYKLIRHGLKKLPKNSQVRIVEQNMYVDGLNKDLGEIIEPLLNLDPNDPLAQMFEQYWQQTVINPTAADIFQTDQQKGLLLSLGIQFRQPHSELADKVVGIYKAGQVLKDSTQVIPLLSQIEPFWRRWELADRELLYVVGILYGGRLVNKNLSNITEVSFDSAVDYIKERTDRITTSGWVVWLPYPLLTALTFLSGTDKGKNVFKNKNIEEALPWVKDFCGRATLEHAIETKMMTLFLQQPVANEAKKRTQSSNSARFF